MRATDTRSTSKTFKRVNAMNTTKLPQGSDNNLNERIKRKMTDKGKKNANLGSNEKKEGYKKQISKKKSVKLEEKIKKAKLKATPSDQSNDHSLNALSHQDRNGQHHTFVSPYQNKPKDYMRRSLNRSSHGSTKTTRSYQKKISEDQKKKDIREQRKRINSLYTFPKGRKKISKSKAKPSQSSLLPKAKKLTTIEPQYIKAYCKMLGARIAYYNLDLHSSGLPKKPKRKHRVNSKSPSRSKKKMTPTPFLTKIEGSITKK